MAKKKDNHSKNQSNCDLAQESLGYLKLRKQPFGLEILSEDTFFNSQELEKITDNLKHQSQFSHLLLIVEGDYGSGKTSLYRHFISHQIENTKILPVQAEVTDTLVQIQQKISIHLQDLGDANHLDDNLKSLQTFDQYPLLILDDAHVLSDTTIQEIFRYRGQLQAEQGVELKLIFFGNVGLSTTIQKITDLKENKIYVQNMPEYSGNLLKDFIFHKLKIAGYTSEPFLSDKELATIEKKAGTTALGSMCLAAQLIDKHVKKQTTPSLSKWVKISAISILLIAIATTAIIYFTVLLPSQTEDGHKADNTNLIQEPEHQKTQQPAEEQYQEITLPQNNLPDNQFEVQEPADTETSRINNIQTESTETPDTLETSTANDSSITAAAEEELEAPAEVTTTQADSLQAKTDITDTLMDTTAQAVKNDSQEKLAVIKEEIPEIKPEPEPEPVPALPAALEQLNQLGLKDKSWLLQNNSNDWTLQLIGARDPETLLKFALKHQLSNNSAWYKTWLSSKPYYVIVHGQFNSRDSAREGIQLLSPTLRNAKPWVKSMKSVHSAIK